MVRRRSSPLLRRSGRALVGLVAGVAHLLAASLPAWADALDDAAAEGQGWARSIIPDVRTQAELTEDEVLRLFPDSAAEQDIDLSDLFPAYGASEPVDVEALFRDDAGLRAAGAAAGAALETDATAHGAAWTVMRETRDRAGVDLRDDPVFAHTKDVLATLDTLAARFTACDPSNTWEPRDLVTRRTVERTCLRVSEPTGKVQVRHDLGMELSSLSASVSGLPERLSRVEVDFRVGRARAEYRYLERYRCGVGDESTWCSRTVTRTATRSAPALDYDRLCVDGGASVAVLREVLIPQGGELSVGSSTPPSCANGLVYTMIPSGTGCWQVRYSLGEGEFGYRQECGGSRLELDVALTELTADAWGPPDIVADLVSLKEGGCTPTFTAVAGSTGEPDSCVETGSGEICPGDALAAGVAPPPFDPGEAQVSRLAMTVEADVSACRPTVAPEESCSALRENPACAYRTTWPVTAEGGETATLFEDVYDCEIDRTVETAALGGALVCPPRVRGVGDDLIVPVEETNESFAEVAAQLSAARFMAMDTVCGDPDDPAADPLQCEVFKGDKRSCKRAIFGVVDCCESPGGVSLAQYLQLAFAVGELDGAIGQLDATSALRGAWEVAASPFHEAWAAVSRNFASGVNSITGTTLIQPSDAAAQGLISTIEQTLLNQTAEWTASIFGEAAANSLFVNATNGTAAVSGGTLTGNVALGPQLALAASVLSYVMIAYTVYNVALLVATIVWSCSEDELETAVKKELKSCHYNGTYCSSSVLGVCLTRKRSYCCFSSPLSRIMQQEIRDQLGKGWGSAEEPNCEGFTLAELQTVDFGALDLTEWMEILLDEGVMPDAPAVSLDGMTGAGRALSEAMPPDVPRVDAYERAIGRAAVVDADGVAVGARDELIGDGSP